MTAAFVANVAAYSLQLGVVAAVAAGVTWAYPIRHPQRAHRFWQWLLVVAMALPLMALWQPGPTPDGPAMVIASVASSGCGPSAAPPPAPAPGRSCPRLQPSASSPSGGPVSLAPIARPVRWWSGVTRLVRQGAGWPGRRGIDGDFDAGFAISEQTIANAGRVVHEDALGNFDDDGTLRQVGGGQSG